jgi:hypothetical protein
LVQLYLLWAVAVGLGTGSTALVLSATVVHRWFTAHRGLATACSSLRRSRMALPLDTLPLVDRRPERRPSGAAIYNDLGRLDM